MPGRAEVLAWEEGGPNDPRTFFNALRESLGVVKDELSPWGWRAYHADFRDRQKAEKKLHGLNTLPGSGAEPKDGILQGTPLWQERLDKMLLAEHLKTKVMSAHSYFGEASDLLLKCHGWLVKDGLLAEKFVDCITHVPTSKFEKIDLLQEALFKSKKETEDARTEFDDFKVTLRRNRELYCQRIVAHQNTSIGRKRCDDVFISWSYRAQRAQVLRLIEFRAVLEARVCTLEATHAAQTEELEESQRQWEEEKAELTEDRDKFKKLYNKMVKAHEQAMADLETAAGTADGQAKMIQVLSTEKSRLTDEVEELSETKRRLEKQLAEARDKIAVQNEEIRRLVAQMRESEVTLLDSRLEVGRLEERQKDLNKRLDAVGAAEARLRDDLLVSRSETAAGRARTSDVRRELFSEQELRRRVEAQRDLMWQRLHDHESMYVDLAEEARGTVISVQKYAADKLQEFKTVELARVREEFRIRTEEIMKRNEQLEREVAISDECGPHLATLNPLTVDESRLCASCRRTIVFEGPMSD